MQNAGLQLQTGVPKGLIDQARLDLALDHLHLEFRDGLGGVETLRARLGAVHDGVAAVEAERILEVVETFAGGFVTGILDPAGGLKKGGRAEEAV